MTRKQYNPVCAIRPDDTDRAIMDAIRQTLPPGSNNTKVIRTALQAWADMQQAKELSQPTPTLPRTTPNGWIINYNSYWKHYTATDPAGNTDYFRDVETALEFARNG